jgi:hypothetical protein
MELSKSAFAFVYSNLTLSTTLSSQPLMVSILLEKNMYACRAENKKVLPSKKGASLPHTLGRQLPLL